MHRHLFVCMPLPFETGRQRIHFALRSVVPTRCTPVCFDKAVRNTQFVCGDRFKRTVGTPVPTRCSLCLFNKTVKNTHVCLWYFDSSSTASRSPCLAAARSRLGSNTPPARYSLPRRHFVTHRGRLISHVCLIKPFDFSRFFSFEPFGA